MAATAEPTTLLSFDVEEFDLPLELGRPITPEQQLRVGAEGTQRTLDLLDRCAAEAGRPLPVTLFVTGRFAAAFPQLIERAVRSGHEIASHSMTHTGFSDDDPAMSRDLLRRISGQSVLGFRRPRLTPTSPSLLTEAGYRYASNLNPTWLPGRYNNFRKPRTPFTIATSTGPLVEVPAAVTPLLRIPLFWLAFKNFPLWLTRRNTRAALAGGGPVMLYFHPWELCDLSTYGLPRHITGPGPDAMAARMRAYVLWLAQQSRLATTEQWLRSRGMLD